MHKIDDNQSFQEKINAPESYNEKDLSFNDEPVAEAAPSNLLEFGI